MPEKLKCVILKDIYMVRKKQINKFDKLPIDSKFDYMYEYIKNSLLN